MNRHKVRIKSCQNVSKSEKETNKNTAAYCIHIVLSTTVLFVEEAEEGAGRELKRSRAECARAALDTTGLSLLSGTHPPPLDTAGLGAGASNRGGDDNNLFRYRCSKQLI